MFDIEFAGVVNLRDGLVWVGVIWWWFFFLEGGSDGLSGGWSIYRTGIKEHVVGSGLRATDSEERGKERRQI